MKKIFKLQVENKNAARQLESVKNEIRKYFKRERKKKLPENAVYWDFDCRFGKTSDEAQIVGASEITAALDKAHTETWDACYVEIFSKAVMKSEDTSTEEAPSE